MLTPWQVGRKMQVGLASVGLLPKPNLLGDRSVEWSWVAAHLGHEGGEVLDFGSGGSLLSLLAARRGYRVTAIDVHPVTWWYRHPRMRCVQADLFQFAGSETLFDVIINCSTIEHVGLAHRYGVSEERAQGDLEAMAVLRRLLKPSGMMLLTIPVGQDAVFAPLHRVYGRDRLPRLLNGWTIVEREFWSKDAQNQWSVVDENAALDCQPRAWSYALGLYVLRPGIA